MRILPFIPIIAFVLISCNQQPKNDSSTSEEAIISQWNLAHNERDIEIFSNLYADEVNFYQKEMPKNKGLDEKLKLFEKHPDFYQQINGAIEKIPSDNGNIKCTFIKSVTINGKTTDYPSYLVIKLSGDKPKIIAEGDFITDKALTQNKPTKSENSNTFIKGIKGIELSYEEAEKGTDYYPDFPNNIVAPEKIVVFFEQLRFVFKAVFEDNVRAQLPVNFDIGLDTSDSEIRDPKRTNEYFIGQHDFDDDNIDEIIIALKDEVQSDNAIQVNIFKYYPPAKKEFVNRRENWELIGNFTGGLMFPCEAKVNGKSVRMDRNYRGFYYEWTFVKGKFVDTGDY